VRGGARLPDRDVGAAKRTTLAAWLAAVALA
jgi:hypothetical protein